MTSPLVRLVLAGAKPSAPDRLLITLVKSPAGALVRGFPGVVTGNFNLRPAAKLELARTSPRNRCTSAPDKNFINIINSLSGAAYFALESTSRPLQLI